MVSKSAKNSMIKCHYSQALSVIEKQTNNHNFFDAKVPIEEKVATFEGNSSISKTENTISNALID